MAKIFSFKNALLLGSLVALAGCGNLALWRANADYSVTGLDNKPDLKEDVEKFLKADIATIQKSDSKAEQQNQQLYEQRTLQAELVKKMQSEGYYDAAVEFRAGDKDWTGTYSIDPGALYTIHGIKASPEGYNDFLVLPPDLKPGMPLRADLVLKTQTDFYNAIQKDQCFFTLEVKNEVVLNRRTHSADVTYAVAAGPRAKFGRIKYEGSDGVKSSYLWMMVPWKRGDCFNRDAIEKYRTSLFETGLFSRVDTVLPEVPDEDGSVPITFTLQDRAPRTLSAGANYYTDQGVGVTFGWKHRNFFGGGEAVSADLILSQKIQKLSGTFNKPFFLRKDQSLALNADIGHEDSDAYNQTGINTGAAVKRSFSKRLTGSTGIDLNIVRIEDKSTGSGAKKESYALLSLPQTLTYDSRDNVLDATRGWFLEGGVAPYFDAFGQSSPFWKTTGSARTYINVANRTTLALRVKAGSILGPSTTNIPATERFYAGGGGSVRGFDYQGVGPAKDGQPVGGRSLAEASAELRFKLTDTIGAVTFVDAGSVGAAVLPTFSDMAVGAGAGLRYYTGFGPLRLDVGVPVSGKQPGASKYGVYISIGQAF